MPSLGVCEVCQPSHRPGPVIRARRSRCCGGVLISADIAGTGWRAIFLVSVPVCAAVIAAAIRWLPADAGRGTAGLDLAGTAVGAYLATHVSDDGGRRTRAAKPRHSSDLMTVASQGSNS
jgi:hypothetical protein